MNKNTIKIGSTLILTIGLIFSFFGIIHYSYEEYGMGRWFRDHAYKEPWYVLPTTGCIELMVVFIFIAIIIYIWD